MKNSARKREERRGIKLMCLQSRKIMRMQRDSKKKKKRIKERQRVELIEDSKIEVLVPNKRKEVKQ